MNSNKNFGLTDSVLAAARQAMSHGSVPLTKVEAELAETQKSHTVPKTAKEKSLAALATPKDKITHKDVMVGRGVVAKEEVEQVDESPTAQQVKQGIGIARDKRYAGGNMTGATKAMKKLHPDLADHPAVKKELQKQNEDYQDLDALFTEEELATIAQVADKLQNNK